MASTVQDWQNAVRESYQGLPYSWRSNFLRQPPMPWYNNASAQVPPATGTTPAATNTTSNQQANQSNPGNYSLNMLAGIPQNHFLSALGQQSPALGGLFSSAFSGANNAFQSNPILQGVGGLLNRLFFSRGR